MRRKIWQLPELQCSIIGTCLSLGELRRIARKSKLRLPPDATEFQVHSTFVALCKNDCPAARAVNKLLDRKYAATLRRFGTSKDDDAIRELWLEARNVGDVPGPYWAVMSHPNISDELQAEVFGEVHMLSHLVGASNRADIRRLASLEEQFERLQQRWSRVKAAYRRRFRQFAEENKAAREQIALLAMEAERYRNKAKSLAGDEMRLENEALLRTLSVQSASLAEASMKESNLSRKVHAYAKRLEHLEHELAEKDAETAFLEQEVQRLLPAMAADPCPGGCSKAGTDACPGPDLCGKRILYVGGRVNLVQHYRALVERYGGRFEHHDGGLEDSRNALPGLLGGVDAVVCPVDCVSHDACLRVKEACRHRVKPLKLARSSGLSSLARILGELSADEPTQGGVA
ncbi:MAG: DUF2325 domain-containing protein [Desulfovibrionaceae bacterium]